MLGHTLTNTNGTFNRTLVAGRYGVITPDASYHALSYPAGFVPKSFVLVAGSPVLPAAAQYGLVHPNAATAPDAALLLAQGSSTWYVSGWTQYRDGNAANTLASGLHVYQADKDANTVQGIIVGNWALDPAYPAPIMFAAALTGSAPSAGERALIASSLAQIYTLGEV